MKEGGLHISLAPEHLFTVWGIPVTNTLLSSWVVIALLLTIAFFAGRNIQMVPGRVQNFFELMFGFVLDFMEQTLGSRALAVKYFPLIATIFLFIVSANLLDFLPIFGSIGIHNEKGEFIPFLHAVNSDLNVTLALAIISVFSIEIAGIMALGFFRYWNKFFTLRGKSIGDRILNMFVGLIEFVSEMSRFISFSFRLFGNIFAGQVLLGVVALFVPYVVPAPLMAFELFVGVVQAAVFAMLTLFFIKMAITAPHGGGSEAHGEAHAAH